MSVRRCIPRRRSARSAHVPRPLRTPLVHPAGAPSRDLGAFLPTTREEMSARGWDELDVLIVTGDAYVDHPAFGPVLIAPLPRGPRLPRRASSRSRAGRAPTTSRAWARRACSSASARATSTRCSTSSPRRRRCAARTSTRPAAAPTLRPNRASIVYANLCRQAFPGAARRPRRHRGVAAAHRALRLLDRLRSAARSCSTPRPTCSSSAWASAPRGRSRGGSTRASPSTQLTRRPRHRARPQEPRASGSRLAADASRYVTDGKPVVLPSYEEVARDKAAFARMCARLPVRDQPPQRRARSSSRTATRPSTSTRRRCRSTRPRWTASTTCPSRAARTRATRRAHPGLRDDQALDRDDARLLRRLHLLQHHRARGAHHPEPQRGRASCARCGRSRAWRTSAAPSPTSAARPPTCTRCAARTSAPRARAAACRACIPGHLREPRDRPRRRSSSS